METFTTYGVGPEQPTYNQLREQNQVLREALDTIARGTEDKIPPYRCIDFAMAKRIAQAALTATSQEVL